MIHPAFATLLETARTTHASHPALSEFCDFPDDLTPCTPTPHHIPPADLICADPVVQSATHPLAQAFLTAGPHAKWRETYKETNIAPDFMDRFGCYCLVGTGGAFISGQMSAYVVYMPANLHYPWHQHPAEELYLVLAGQAEFARDGEPPETLHTGDVSRHASDQPHATTTRGQPLLAYVIWRNNLNTPPIWTPGQGL